MRPVHSHVSEHTHRLAKYIDRWLKTVVGAFYSRYSIKDSLALIEVIIHIAPLLDLSWYRSLVLPERGFINTQDSLGQDVIDE